MAARHLRSPAYLAWLIAVAWACGGEGNAPATGGAEGGTSGGADAGGPRDSSASDASAEGDGTLSDAAALDDATPSDGAADGADATAGGDATLPSDAGTTAASTPGAIALFDHIPQFNMYSATPPTNYVPPAGTLMWSNGTIFVNELDAEQKSRIGSDLAGKVSYFAQCDAYDRIGSVFAIVEPSGQVPQPSDPRIELIRFITPLSDYTKGASASHVYPGVDLSAFANVLADPAHDVWIGIGGGSYPTYPGNPCASLTEDAGSDFTEIGFSYSLELLSTSSLQAGPTPAFAAFSLASDAGPAAAISNVSLTATPIDGTFANPGSTLTGKVVVIVSGHGSDVGGDEYENTQDTVTVGNASLGSFSTAIDCAPYAAFSPDGNPGIFQGNTTSNPRNWCPGAIVSAHTFPVTLAPGTTSVSLGIGPGLVPAGSYYQTSITFLAAPSSVYAIPLAAPVAADYGYTAQVTVGDQTFAATIDTGSTTTGVVGTSCTAGCPNVSPRYEPTSSATPTGNTATSTYQDGTSWEGPIYADDVGLGYGSPAVRVDLVDIGQATGFFSGFNDRQGIIGLGPQFNALTGTTGYLPTVLGAGVANVLAFQLCDSTGPNAGTMWLGGDGSPGSTVTYTPLVPITLANPYYAINVDAMSLGGESIVTDAGSLFAQPAIDTGTSFFFVPTSVYDAFVAALEASSGFKALFGSNTFATSGATIGCVAAAGVTDAQVESMLPPLGLSLPNVVAAESDGTLQASPLDTYLYDGGSGSFCLAIQDGGKESILGDAFMQAFLTIIDLENDRVGFAPTGCAKPAVRRVRHPSQRRPHRRLRHDGR